MTRRQNGSVWDQLRRNAGTKALKRALDYAVFPLVVLVSLTRLLFHHQPVRAAQAIVVMSEGGFGHTIWGPDMARRVFAGRRCVFIALSEFGRHNWKAAAIWPDLRVVFLPLSVGLRLGKRPVAIGDAAQMKPVLMWIVCRIARMLAGPQAMLCSLTGLFERAAAFSSVGRDVPRVSLTYRTMMGYFALRRDVPLPSARVPEAWRQRIKGALSQLRVPGDRSRAVRHCCLYLRQKGVGSADVTNSRRVGSPFEAYLPAIRLLNGAGYRVLLTGEVHITRSAYEASQGMLVDATHLGVPRDIFALYAGLEADCFIGENGGGLLPPLVNGIPSLLLNTFPYGHGFCNSWVYYKTVRDADGHLVHYSRLFAEHTHDWEVPGMSVHSQSAEEITLAVSSFIEDVEEPGAPDPAAEALSLFPDYAMIRQAGSARLSPAFVALFEEVEHPVRIPA